MQINISKLTSLSLVVVYLALVSNQTACSKKKTEETESTASYKILNVTGAVGSANSSSIGTLATGVNFATGTIDANASSYYAFQDGKQFINQGKMGDMMSCIVQKLAQRGVIPTDGTSAYFKMDDTMVMKMNATLDSASSTITSYNMYNCSVPSGQSSLAQDQYIGSTLTNGNAAMTFKMNSTSVKVSMSITGTVDSGNWASKSITQNLSITGSFAAQSTITQNASTLVSQSAFDVSSGSLTVQQNSICSLYGNSDDTYAMGEGSAKIKVISGATNENTVSWDDTGTNAGTSSHLSSVSTASYLAVPSTTSINTATAFTSDQTWDCQIVGTPVDMNTLSAGAQTDVQSCFPTGTGGQ